MEITKIRGINDKREQEFNKLGIPDMEEVTELHEGKGEFVNLDFPLPCGQIVHFWDNEKTYYIWL